uniref:Neur_chan_LBD domain-containing protein n=1 Tax=Rhabditophanes sp. KR3021 TaxID=114890 RepID=A0AC35U576_9BILA
MIFCSLFNYIFATTIIFGSFANANYDYNCAWRHTDVKDGDDITEIAHHKYQMLEECVYYKISSEANKDQGRGNSIITLPPTRVSGETLEVEIQQVGFRQIVMNEMFKTMNLNGFILLSWKDRRFKWTQADYKLDEIRLKSSSRLWIPDINTEKSQNTAQSSDYIVYKDIKARNTGNITTRMEYKVEAECDTDYSDFPDDKKHCCFSLKSSMYPTYIRYTILHKILDLSMLKSNWHVSQGETHVVKDEHNPKTESIQVCLHVKRRAPILRIELVLPMVISGLIVILSPFFGKIEVQLYVKLFALLLQFLSFQFLSQKTPSFGFDETVPRLYVFYTFTIIITFLSIILNLVASALNRFPRQFPPPHRLTLFANLFNSIAYCSAADYADDTNLEKASSSKDYSSSWGQIYVALNNIFSMAVLVIYVIGIICIAF